MDLESYWKQENHAREMDVYESQLGWVALRLFVIGEMVDRCKVSVHPPWAGDRKGEHRALRKVRD